MPRGLHRLKEAHQEELEKALRSRRWHARLRYWGERTKGVATLLGALGALFSAGAAVYHRMRGTEVAPPQLPATGNPTVATDRVEKPPLPKP